MDHDSCCDPLHCRAFHRLLERHDSRRGVRRDDRMLPLTFIRTTLTSLSSSIIVSHIATVRAPSVATASGRCSPQGWLVQRRFPSRSTPSMPVFVDPTIRSPPESAGRERSVRRQRVCPSLFRRTVRPARLATTTSPSAGDAEAMFCAGTVAAGTLYDHIAAAVNAAIMRFVTRC
jgi:hypothetical protein